MKELTEKQLNILQFLIEFMKENKYCPSLREIADNYGVTPKVIFDQLNALEKKGYIKRISNRRIDIL